MDKYTIRIPVLALGTALIYPAALSKGAWRDALREMGSIAARISDVLPSFFAFAATTVVMSVVYRSRRRGLEFGGMTALANELLQLLPIAWLGRTFDPLDVLSGLAGVALAGWALRALPELDAPAISPQLRR